MVRGASYAVARERHRDLAVAVTRFPQRADAAPDPDLVFVLVHGIGVSSRYFHPLAAELARRGRVLLIDLPGFGAAPDPRRDVTIADHADVLASVLEASGVVAPVLVGHSWGSQVVSMLAAQHPEISDRVVLMAPTLEPGARTFWRAFGHLMHDALREPPVVFGIAFVDYIIRCGPPYLLRQVPHMLADRMEDRIGRLRGRVLIVNGDRDPIVSSRWARELASLSPRIEFREVRGPHVIMHTDPVMIARHIGAFVDDDETGAEGDLP